MSDHDVNAWSFSGPGETIITDGVWVCPPRKDDTVKVDNHHHLILRGTCMIKGGGENGLDVNNFGRVTIEGDLYITAAKEAQAVVKGGGELHAPGHCIVYGFIEVDGFSDQSRKHATVTGDFSGYDGRPVPVVFGRFRRPQIRHRVMWWPSIKYHAFNLAKDLARLALRIPAGQKGPFILLASLLLQ